MNNIITVKKHDKLPTVKQTEFADKAAEILREADRGNQTTIRASNGAISATVGLNGHRFFPDPNPDPLDEILRLALDTDKVDQK